MKINIFCGRVQHVCRSPDVVIVYYAKSRIHTQFISHAASTNSIFITFVRRTYAHTLKLWTRCKGNVTILQLQRWQGAYHLYRLYYGCDPVDGETTSVCAARPSRCQTLRLHSQLAPLWYTTRWQKHVCEQLSRVAFESAVAGSRTHNQLIPVQHLHDYATKPYLNWYSKLIQLCYRHDNNDSLQC